MQEDYQCRTSPSTIENPVLLAKLPCSRNVTKDPDFIVLKLICNMIMTTSRNFWDLTKAKLICFGHSDVTHVWREDEAAYSERNTIPTMKHGAGNIMVWERSAYSETEELRIIENTLKSTKYIKNLVAACNYQFRN